MKPSFLKPILKAVISAAILWLSLTALSSLILSKTPDPSSLIPAVSTAALMLGGIIAGIISACETENRLLCGLISGFFATLPLFLTTLIIGELDASSLIRMTLCVLCVTLGSILKKTDTSARSSAKKRKAIAKKYSV